MSNEQSNVVLAVVRAFLYPYRAHDFNLQLSVDFISIDILG